MTDQPRDPRADGAFTRMTARGMQHEIFRRAPTLRAFWRAEANIEGGLDDFRAEVIATQAEMFVRHVEGRSEPGMTWRLGQIEEEMGFADGELLGLSDTERRDRIVARLRSWRLPTAQAIRMIALAYAGNEVQTIMDYEAHNITIKFTGSRLPENLAELESEITRIIPARLGPIWFVVTFTTWGDAYEWSRDTGATWQTLYDSGLTWEQLFSIAKEELPTP